MREMIDVKLLDLKKNVCLHWRTKIRTKVEKVSSLTVKGRLKVLFYQKY